LLTSSDNIKDIKNNVVKVVKKAEIISNFENISKIENTNPEAIILTGFFVDKNTIITASH
jgi:hypothetical protein